MTRLVAHGARMMRVGPATVDHYLEKGDRLIDEVGIRAIHTPGHTAGHTAFLWPMHGGALLPGDAIANWFGRLQHAPLVEDWNEAAGSVAVVAELSCGIIAFGHGPVLRDRATARIRRFAEEIA